jgi:predicted membrane-bound dolichyl-phosphate-mannose-protein mannosyltransferase
MLERAFRPAVALLLALMCAAQIRSALQESQTWDEAIHLAAGYAHLRTGEYRLNPEHPPLQKLLSAAALLPLNPRLPVEHPSWSQRDQVVFGSTFLYHNRVSPERLLLAGRIPTVLLSLGLGLALAMWTRRHFGALPAMFALFFYGTDPNFIAHGHYATTDVAAALFFFLTVVSWDAWTRKPERRKILWTGLWMGLALATKFSMLLLPPLLLVLYAVQRWWGGIAVPRFVPAARAWACAMLAAALLVGLAYGPGVIQSTLKLKDAVDRSTTPGRVMHAAGSYLGLPAHPFFTGLDEVARHNKFGHPSYLLGRVSEHGRWQYFPVAFAVKTPTGVLVLLAMLLAAAFLRTRRAEGRTDLPWAVLVVPPALYFASCLASGINLGVRHLLPMYPFLFVLLATGLFRLFRGRAAAVVVAAVAAIQTVEMARAHPHYLAFFNTLSGGSRNGPRYLLDSNLDWGQDLKNLKRYLDRQGLSSVCLCYFGNANPAYYGIRDEPLPTTADREARERMNCIAAISATPLYGLYAPAESYRWLREQRPSAIVGHSIYVYDLRRKP